jgi:DNA-directed RNA polymerase subunit M/transcription elongation factor TFIIS
MGFFSEALVHALFSGRYICHECGAMMEFENESRDILVCSHCGHSVELDYYGSEDKDSYDSLYPTKEEVVGYDDEDDCGETYDEVCGELSDD